MIVTASKEFFHISQPFRSHGSFTVTRPNILLLLSDEHSPLTLGCYGHDFVQTPAMDSLARRDASPLGRRGPEVAA